MNWGPAQHQHPNVPLQGHLLSEPPNYSHYLSEQRKTDENFINNFVLNIQKRKTSQSKQTSIKISEGKTILLDLIKQKKNLEHELDNLNINDDNFDSKCEALTKSMNETNKEILKFQGDTQTHLKSVVSKRLKKREAIKKRKLKYKAMKQQKEDDIKEKHKIIDKLLSERSEEVEAVKREAALKRQADAVLHEVRRKKYEGKKMLNMLSALAKLRELRSKQEEERGGYCSKQLTETFNQVMSRFQKLWENQIEIYNLEEKGLRIMLEENTLPQAKESKVETNLLEWEKVLFGDISNNENEKILTIADTNIQDLVQVRREWDQFLTKETTAMTSSIPPGWVLPPEAPNDEWKVFTKAANKITNFY